MAKQKKAHQQTKQTITSGPSTAQLNKKSNFNLEEKVCISLLLFLIILIYIIRSKFSLIPFERDEGIYSYFGKLILEGKIPYKDFFEIKFPGLFYFYGFMVYVFGATVEGMHTGFMYLNIATIIIIYNTSRLLFSPIAGIISATTFAFVSLTATLSGFTVQSEHGVAFFISLGVLFYALSKKYNKWYWYGLMGFAMGSSFMIKTNGVFLCLWGGLIIILDFLFTKPKNIKQSCLNLLAYVSGGVLIVLIFFFIMYTKGVFNEMIYYTVEIPKKYIGNVPFDIGYSYFKNARDSIVQNHKFFWVHSVLAIVLCLVKSVDYKLKFFGITLLAFSFLTIVPGFYFYGHYWIQAIPGVSIVAGLSYHSIISFLKKTFNNKYTGIKYIYISIFILLTYSHVSALKPYYFSPNYDLILRVVYGNNPFPEAMKIGNFINANAKPEDNLVLIGSEPQIYFYTNKKCPSPYAYFTALVNNTPEHKKMQREFVADVEKAKPKYLVYFNHPISLLVQPNTDKYIFDWAYKYFNDYYNVVGIADMIDGQPTKYLWREQVAGYKPVSQNVIYTFERKPEPAPTSALTPETNK